jgi:hypothetical protein
MHRSPGVFFDQVQFYFYHIPQYIFPKNCWANTLTV